MHGNQVHILAFISICRLPTEVECRYQYVSLLTPLASYPFHVIGHPNPRSCLNQSPLPTQILPFIGYVNACRDVESVNSCVCPLLDGTSRYDM